MDNNEQMYGLRKLPMTDSPRDVTRYEVTCDGEDYEDAEGRFVEYADYANDLDAANARSFAATKSNAALREEVELWKKRANDTLSQCEDSDWHGHKLQEKLTALRIAVKEHCRTCDYHAFADLLGEATDE